MKADLTKDEWWPVYLIEEGTDFEIPEDLMERYLSAVKAFDVVQDELRNIWNSRYKQPAGKDAPR